MSHLLVIPVFNEESSLVSVLTNTCRHLPAEINRILLINDGSTDGSAAILDQLAARDSRLVVRHRPRNLGYGATQIEAMRFGQAGGFQYLITMDCDEQHRPEDLARFVAFDPAVDVVSGSRYLSDSLGIGHAPEQRVQINARITALVNRECGWNLTDTFCGFKRYRLDSVRPDLFCVNGYAFPMEFWAFAARYGLRVQELAVPRIYITDDRSFGEDLDRQRRRYRYYLSVWREARRRFAS
jgi:glycosyltransferase involved in cell wall biosynthesis